MKSISATPKTNGPSGGCNNIDSGRAFLEYEEAAEVNESASVVPDEEVGGYVTACAALYFGSSYKAAEGAADVIELARRAFLSLKESLTSSVSELKSMSIESCCEMRLEKKSRGCRAVLESRRGEPGVDESEIER